MYWELLMAKAYKFTKCNLRSLMTNKNITFKALGDSIGATFQQVQNMQQVKMKCL